MTSHDFKTPDLQKAFRPMPASCRTALADAARSVQEGKMKKRTPARIALIAALVLAAMMAVAYAATQLGLTDFFQSIYNTTLPDSAQTTLSDTEEKAYDVGPLTLTLQEALADGRIAYVTTRAAASDGSSAVIQMGNGDLSDEIPSDEAKRLNIPEHTSFTDAAAQAGVPLYMVSAYLTVDQAVNGGEGMQDILWDGDGSALLISMLTTNNDAVGDALAGTLTLRVNGIDPVAGKGLEDENWLIQEEISIPVHGVTSERVYAPSDGASLGSLTVVSVKAEQTCAGVYLTATLTANGDASREDPWALLKGFEFADAQGEAYPRGLYLGQSLDDEQWPTLVWKKMISADDLPDILQIANGNGGYVALE